MLRSALPLRVVHYSGTSSISPAKLAFVTYRSAAPQWTACSSQYQQAPDTQAQYCRKLREYSRRRCERRVHASNCCLLLFLRASVLRGAAAACAARDKQVQSATRSSREKEEQSAGTCRMSQGTCMYMYSTCGSSEETSCQRKAARCEAASPTDERVLLLAPAPDILR